ncbi:MAG: GMC oxidoreductase, partial [Solirubrobacteraceae bacterium]
MAERFVSAAEGAGVARTEDFTTSRSSTSTGSRSRPRWRRWWRRAATRASWRAAGPWATSSSANLDPGPGVASDEQLEAWIRVECQHTHHAACTCRIGAEDDGVLDPEL